MNMKEMKKLPVVSEQDVQDDNVTLKENEYLFKLDEEREVGFMAKMNKSGTIPAAIKSWGKRAIYHPVTRKFEGYENSEMMILTEDYRANWEIIGIRNGTSTPWVRLKHSFGFIVEVNVPGFVDLIGKVTIKEGIIQDLCYFDAYNKKLLIK